ncbi:hypothetical protein B0H11DRAFT_2210088 [Mycena galericulata]|nr:hypothetical protein B0H11DRAFT_2210088 [Mycena galericulata]
MSCKTSAASTPSTSKPLAALLLYSPLLMLVVRRHGDSFVSRYSRSPPFWDRGCDENIPSSEMRRQQCVPNAQAPEHSTCGPLARNLAPSALDNAEVGACEAQRNLAHAWLSSLSSRSRRIVSSSSLWAVADLILARKPTPGAQVVPPAVAIPRVARASEEFEPVDARDVRATPLSARDAPPPPLSARDTPMSARDPRDGWENPFWGDAGTSRTSTLETGLVVEGDMGKRTGTEPTAAGSKRPGHRGKGEATTAKKMGRYLAEGGAYQRGQKKIEELTAVFELDLPFPDHFAGGTRNRTLVGQKAAEDCWLDPSELPDITTDDRLKLFIKTNEPTPEQLENFGPNQYPRWLLDKHFADPSDRTPEWLAIRFPDVIPLQMQQKLLASWDKAIAFGLRFPKTEAQRSSTPALHLGIVPRKRTFSSIQLARLKEKQVTARLDEFLGIIKNGVVPKLKNLVEWDIGEGARIRDRNSINSALEVCIGTSVQPSSANSASGPTSISEGSSEVLHVDWNDNLHTSLSFALGITPGENSAFHRLATASHFGLGPFWR